ncbi:MAG: 30S ribosomal protein S20 [Gemmatimonadales bacterium]|nr:30S ribosomal protein S20 [Gemmatimonadota bacterium]MCC7132122.1 30S ribosomal protein S20 [Gemmatimonadales bacterium]MDX2060047.1 30S ribosomal protein S20 [Gemmatimonadales bacterium]
MPRIKSAKKRMRQTRARTTHNRAQRSQLRTAIKNARQAETPEARAAALAVAEKLVSRAGQKRIIHPNAAARIKSRLAKTKAK